jgi:hypothetical protein
VEVVEVAEVVEAVVDVDAVVEVAVVLVVVDVERMMIRNGFLAPNLAVSSRMERSVAFRKFTVIA